MEIKNLKFRYILDQERTLTNEYAEFGKLIQELQKKYIPSNIIILINEEIEEINSLSGPEAQMLKALRKGRSRILALIGKELSLVAKNHYRNVWRVVGMLAFGIPLGFTIGTSFGNMALLALGLPMGLLFGMMVGTAMDKKAYDNGKQLDIVIKY